MIPEGGPAGRLDFSRPPEYPIRLVVDPSRLILRPSAPSAPLFRRLPHVPDAPPWESAPRAEKAPADRILRSPRFLDISRRSYSACHRSASPDSGPVLPNIASFAPTSVHFRRAPIDLALSSRMLPEGGPGDRRHFSRFPEDRMRLPVDPARLMLVSFAHSIM